MKAGEITYYSLRTRVEDLIKEAIVTPYASIKSAAEITEGRYIMSDYSVNIEASMNRYCLIK